MKGKLRILAENLIFAIPFTALTFMLRFYELPDSRVVMPAFWSQMLRNYVIVYVLITAVRLIEPYVKRIPLKWKRETAEKYEKLLFIAFYMLGGLVAYLLLRSAATDKLGYLPRLPF